MIVYSFSPLILKTIIRNQIKTTLTANFNPTMSYVRLSSESFIGRLN